MSTVYKTIHHPKLGATVTVPESTADTLIDYVGGWKVATKAQAAELDTDRPVEPPAPTE